MTKLTKQNKTAQNHSYDVASLIDALQKLSPEQATAVPSYLRKQLMNCINNLLDSSNLSN